MWEQRFRPWFWVIPILLASSANLNVLGNGFGWDDENILPNLAATGRWWTVFLPDSNVAADETPPYYRPLISLSYFLDHAVWGDNPFGFHQSVYLVHILNTALVFSLARGLMKGAERSIVPVLAASLFAVHPVHAEAVAWIAGRNDVFCTTFLLSSLLLYIGFHRTGRWILCAFSLFFILLALLTKETALGLILLFPLYEYMASSHPRHRLWRRIVIGGTILLMISGLYFFLRTVNISSPFGDASFMTFFSQAGIQKAIGAAGLYLKLMVFPYPHNPFIATVPTSGFSFIFACLLLIMLLGGLVFAVVLREVPLGTGLAWTIFTLAPAVSVTVLDLAAAPAAERYLYTPSVGFIIAATWLMAEGTKQLQSMRARTPLRIQVTASLLFILLVGVWGWEAWNRNVVWQNSLTFWQAAVAATPEASFAQRELAKHYTRMGRDAEAERLYQQAIATDEKTLGPDHPDVAQSLNNLGVIYYTQGRYAEAEPLHRRALVIREKALKPDHRDIAASLNNLAIIYDTQGRYAEAEPLYRKAIAIWEKTLGPDHPDVAKGLHNLAVPYRAEGRYAEAEPLYRRAIAIWEKALGPDHPNVATSMESYAALLREMKREPEAVKMEDRARAIRNALKNFLKTDIQSSAVRRDVGEVGLGHKANDKEAQFNP